MKFLRTILTICVLTSVASSHVIAMDDDFRLNYGGRSVQFIKSKDLIAIKAFPGRDNDMDSLLRSRLDKFTKGEDLDDFKIIKVNEYDTSNEELDMLRQSSVVDKGTHVFHTSDDVPFVPT